MGWFRRRPSSRWLWTVALVVAIGLAQGYAWLRYELAKSDLSKDQPGEAANHLAQASAIWPWGQRPVVLIARARAARKSGDLPAAMEFLREARRNESATTPELTFEWSLLHAVDGNASEVAEYLQQRAEAEPEQQREVWEALVQGYMAVYRANDAYTVCQQWVAKYPADLRAKELRGLAAIQGRGRGLRLGADDLAEVLKGDPSRISARTARSIALLDLGAFDEAQPELEHLVREQPGESMHRVRLARCLNMTGRGPEAEAMLDGVLREQPENGMALRTRGQFALASARYEEAERWLARAAVVLPNDYQTLFLYSQSLQQTGKGSEAERQLQRASEVRSRSTQLAELRTRKLAENPLDPALYTEMGQLLLASGKIEQGLRWLEAAVALEPNYRPAHSILADHYERSGNPAKSALHRKFASAVR